MAKPRFRSLGATLVVVGLLSGCNAPDGDKESAHAGAERGDIAAVQPLRRVSDRLVAPGCRDRRSGRGWAQRHRDCHVLR